MHAVMGLWTMDPDGRERQERDLRETIVPMVRTAPGFVRGSWAREVAGGRSATFIVFEDEPSARRFADFVRANAPRQADAGVTNDGMVVVELVAEA